MADARFSIEGVSYLNPADCARYRAAGAWVESTAGEVLRSMARELPKKWALISQERRLTYAEFDAASERLVITFPRIEPATGRPRVPSALLPNSRSRLASLVRSCLATL